MSVKQPQDITLKSQSRVRFGGTSSAVSGADITSLVPGLKILYAGNQDDKTTKLFPQALGLSHEF